MKNLILDYESLAENAKTAPKKLLGVFKRAGGDIASSWVGKAKREAGVSFKPICLVFADSQEVELRVKQTGDIYQVRLNGKPKPIKEQEDQNKAVSEVISMVEGNSNRFQVALTRRKAKLPQGIQTTLKRKETAFAERKAELKQKIDEADAEIERLNQILAA